MIELPSLHAIATMVLVIAMFTAFARGRMPVEIISLLVIGVIALGLYVFPFPGERPQDGLALAFDGFGHQALVAICALMILGRGLVVTGALDPAARSLAKVWRFNRWIGLLLTLLLAMALSMVVNDTPVLVLLLPILVQLAGQGGMAVSKTLIPVNAAILIGGMATTIGTSTNILVVSIATDLGMAPIPVFHFTPIVMAAALVVLPYLWLIMPRLLPDNSPEAGQPPREFVATLRIGGSSPLLGKPMAEVLKRLPPAAVFRFSPERTEPLEAGMRIGVEGTPEATDEAMRLLDATAAPAWLVRQLMAESAASGEDLLVAEMAVATDSRLIGLTLQTAGLKDLAVLGLHRAHRFWRATRLLNAESAIAEGDVLRVMGTARKLQDFAHADGLLLLEGGQELPRSSKALLALAIVAGSIAPASFGLVPIAISALGGAVLMFVTGCVKFERVGRALSAQVIVLVAASIAVGRVVLDSGAAEFIGQLLAVGLQYLPPAGVLAAIMSFVTLLTNFASNATAAAVGTPIAYSLAQQLGMPVEPMVLAVLFGCNLCYATPVAYQTNMLIMAEGNYRFADYIRTGIPLVALMVVTLSVLLVMRYGL
jgi:di/tricarboxylate transporter